METVGWNSRTMSKGRMAKASDVDDLPQRMTDFLNTPIISLGRCKQKYFFPSRVRDFKAAVNSTSRIAHRQLR
jgi:hypothetical protein